MVLREDQDAFGRMLLDSLNGEAGYELCERDDGRLDVSVAGAHYLKLSRQPDPGTRDLLDAARGRVLDVGCGAGRYAIALQRRGHHVVGVDHSPAAIGVAQQQGLKRAELLGVADVSRKRLGEFDTVLLGGNNFGLLESSERARVRLERFATMTPDDGQILATSIDVSRNDNPEHLAYRRQNVERGRLPGQVRLRVRWKQLKTPWFDYLLVSPDEMQEVLEPTPWRVERTIPMGGPNYAAVLRKRT